MSVDQASISTQLAASLAAVNAALAAVPDIELASPFQLAPVATAVNAEIATIQSAIDEFDADIITTSVAGMVTGNPAPTLWALLWNQASDSAQLATLLNALGYLQRLATNLAQVSTAITPAVPQVASSAAQGLDFSSPDNLVYAVSL